MRHFALPVFLPLLLRPVSGFIYSVPIRCSVFEDIIWCMKNSDVGSFRQFLLHCLATMQLIPVGVLCALCLSGDLSQNVPGYLLRYCYPIVALVNDITCSFTSSVSFMYGN